MEPIPRIFVPGFDLGSAVRQVREVGYLFAPALDEGVRAALAAEAERLVLEEGDHLRHPINAGTPIEVRQMHERRYLPLGHPDAPVATAVCEALAREAETLDEPELRGWKPNEIGYQRYRGASDRISPHRDRSSDRVFSVTFTLTGAARVRILESEVDPPDYGRLRLVSEFPVEEGSVMFLRAPGLGSGRQAIHEVLPPERAPRVILNLRMRPTVLKPPSETRWRGV